MAALSAASNLTFIAPAETEAKQVYATADVFYTGALIEIDPGTGLVMPLGQGNAASYFYGLCTKTLTTAANSTSKVSLNTEGKIVKAQTITGVTGDGDVGRVVYCSTDNIDDGTLVQTSGTTRAIGVVYQHISATSCHVKLYSADEQKSRLEGLKQSHASVASSSEHENTTTEAMFDTTYTIPANTLRVGDVVHIRAFGTVVDSNSTDTLTLVLRWGGLTGTAVETTGAIDVADNDTFGFDCYATVRTIGASGTFVASTFYHDPDAAGGNATTLFGSLTSTATDTTADIQIGVSADWSVAHADNEAQLDQLIVQVYGQSGS